MSHSRWQVSRASSCRLVWLWMLMCSFLNESKKSYEQEDCSPQPSTSVGNVPGHRLETPTSLHLSPAPCCSTLVATLAQALSLASPPPCSWAWQSVCLLLLLSHAPS